MIHKRLNDINTICCHDNELLLSGTDEYGNDITITFDAINFLQWIDKDTMSYIKEKTIEYIEELNMNTLIETKELCFVLYLLFKLYLRLI